MAQEYPMPYTGLNKHLMSLWQCRWRLDLIDQPTSERGNKQIHMDSDGDKIYTKIIDLDEIYNFVIQIFSFRIILVFK